MPKQHPVPFSTFLRTVHSALRMAATHSIPHDRRIGDEDGLFNETIDHIFPDTVRFSSQNEFRVFLPHLLVTVTIQPVQ